MHLIEICVWCWCEVPFRLKFECMFPISTLRLLEANIISILWFPVHIPLISHLFSTDVALYGRKRLSVVSQSTHSAHTYSLTHRKCERNAQWNIQWQCTRCSTTASSPFADTYVHRLQMNDNQKDGWECIFTSNDMSCQCKCDCDYDRVYYSNIELFIDALLSSFMSSHKRTHAHTQRRNIDRNECNANRKRVVWLFVCVGGDDGWRSSRLKFNAQMDLHIIEFAPPSPQTTDLFEIKRKMWISFHVRLTLT